MLDTHTHSIADLETRATELGPATDVTGDDRNEFTDTLLALADAYGSQGEFEAEAETIDRLATLETVHPETGVALADALANATAVTDRDTVYETGLDPDRIDTFRERLEDRYEAESSEPIAAALARGTVQTAHAYGRAERAPEMKPLLERLERLYDTHETDAIAAQLARSYAYGERYLDEPAGRSRLERAELLFDRHPTDAVATGVAGVIAGRTNADASGADVDTIESRIAQIQALGQQHPDAETDRWLPAAAANAARASFEAADYARLEHWGDQAFEFHETLETPTSAEWAAAATFYSARGSFFESDIEKGERKLDRLRSLESRFENPVFEQWLARSMFDAARSYAEVGRYEEARSMADELEAYAVDHADQEAIESGLESLRNQAPGLFGEIEDGEVVAGTTCDHEGEEGACGHEGAESTGEVETADTTGTSEPVESDASPTETTQGTSVPIEETGQPTDHRAVEASQEPIDIAQPNTTGDAGESIETQPTDLDRSPSILDEGLTGLEADSLDENPGCGSCGPDGCGNCGSQPVTVEPESLRAIAAGGVAAIVVTVSVLYTLYRFAALARGAIGSGSD